MTNLNYRSERYLKKSRWISYWHQIISAYKLSPSSVLEIGIGSDIVSLSLNLLGIKDIFTADISRALNPDVCASVTTLPFKSKTVDLILCFQVLEHLPFEEFSGILDELHRVTKEHAIISLPDSYSYIKLNFKLPGFKEQLFVLKSPLAYKKNIHREHHWEIGRRGMTLSNVNKHIENKFIIINSFLSEGNFSQRFFVLKKR